VTEVSWSRTGGGDCIRLTNLPGGASVQVRPTTAAEDPGLPPMAGRLVRDGADLCFVPRFAFLDGTAYTVTVEGAPAATLVRARPDRMATTEVADIRPTAAEVPCNLLRLYVWFSAPMSEGSAARHVRLLDEAGEVMVGALLPAEQELWDADRRRLTVLLDPARIKRGLVAHRQAGYPLRSGATFRVEIEEGFRDALGVPLRTRGERRYDVGADERRRVQPEGWNLSVPRRSTVEPLEVAFDRPLDHALLMRCLRVVSPDGRLVEGRTEVGPEERSWRVAPAQPWASGPHLLVVDPILEDLAGNSVSRVFDRDLNRSEDEPRAPRPVTLTFRAR
jgi:hypothetical protein